MQNYDVTNNGRARRVFYTGVEKTPARKDENGNVTVLADQHMVALEPGEKAEGVPITDSVIERLRASPFGLVLERSAQQDEAPQQQSTLTLPGKSAQQGRK